MQIQHQGDYYYKHNPEYHRFADFMGLKQEKRLDLKSANKLAVLYDWATMKSGSKDFREIVLTVDKLKRGLGINATGELLINELHKWTRLEMDRFRKNNLEIKEEQKKAEVIKESEEKINQDRIRKQMLINNRTKAKFDSNDQIKEMIKVRPESIEKTQELKTSLQTNNARESVEI